MRRLTCFTLFAVGVAVVVCDGSVNLTVLPELTLTENGVTPESSTVTSTTRSKSPLTNAVNDSVTSTSTATPALVNVTPHSFELKTNLTTSRLDADWYRYTQKTIQLFRYINNETVYLDISNREVGQYVVMDQRPHTFLNIIQYSLERNDEWDDDDQVVLRHETSLCYFCMTKCGVPYVSVNLTLDCVFILEVLPNLVDYSPEVVRLRKRFGHSIYNVNMDYGQINFDESATLMSVEVDSRGDPVLSPLIDDANADPCVTDYIITQLKDAEAKQDVVVVEGAATSWFILMMCLGIGMFTVFVGIIIVVVMCVRIKRNTL
ncbi:fgf-3 [Clostera anastomosis granulovirus A]|uniref:Fgf-3 n=1 Tax=Clostera anastomosis granulovirus A TaxID=1986289 RepID=U5KBV7_9BBAC|nr:fgf-3 [Clostera anastomosis granulovirus Henan]AGQ20379.1 fgf-3 [Clostera anastomosis granulovirus Henan]